MKLRMVKTYRVYQLYDTMEINKEDYPELQGMSDEEAISYLDENMYEFEIKGSQEGSLANEFEFNQEMIEDEIFDEEYELKLIEE
jgi:hypothetical protein